MREGNVFNIQRFTIHDGPGIRTELFLKGCPLKCQWCGNPESWKSNIEIGVYTSKCISEEKCGSCKEVCSSEGTLNFADGKLVSIDRDKCVNCFLCYEECPSDAIKQWGKSMSVSECMEIIRKDRGYYERSGGGVTISGGEPLLQVKFVEELFKKCKEEEIHTCIESCFHVKWESIERILLYSDLVISDIKHMDTNIHKKYTGVGNELVLENLEKLKTLGKDLILRIPIIPNVNDNIENIEATADFIINKLNNKVRTLQLLSFMRLGEEKYCSLGMPYQMEEVNVDREKFQKSINNIAKYFKERGIHCTVGTKEKE
ncbi:MAG: (2S)-3-sulfopropanediol dehydratase activating enzyme [Sarcina sp.]